MAKELQSIEIGNIPEVLRLAEEVQKSKQPCLLKRQGEQVAVIMPIAPVRTRPRRTGIISRDDPFVRMAGTGDSGIIGGISGRKYDYFRKAFGVEEHGE